MKLGRLLGLMLAALLIWAACSTTGHYRTSPQLPGATVKVSKPRSHGSGFHIGSGLILTAAHVVEDTTRLKIKTSDGKEVDGIVLWSNKAYDSALVFAPQLRAHTASVTCRLPVVGEEVTAKGNPLDDEFMTTWGHVAGIGPIDMDDLGHVRLNMTLVPGMSGGPVYDSSGNVLGIVQATFGQFAYSVMVPTAHVCRLLGRV